MPNKHLQSVNSLKVCQWRSWHNEQQGHLTHNHITTCAFSSILLLSIIPRECNTLFMDVLFTAPDTSTHVPLDLFLILICEIHPPLLLFCAKFDWQLSMLLMISHYCAEPRKESSKQNLNLSNCYLWVLLQVSWLLSKPNFFIYFFNLSSNFRFLPYQ